ncbi:hypothetical protein EOB36_17285 [Mesorhizobium sp. M6A.T.Cr.TU.017.01.1.1]|uniref:hypothetical protein n=1 Tax=Mesorhizobium sp. M6A.T.Cr.TU.017.01.1.1 TaxID=2496774 RepID=UPI000FD1EF8C|nr:hypothetical protein [Mesorhizobium sp. M6A.T.Cr.TU.017.01.1.1]RUV00281.1 hypothetical protein EOB36_17285 [Mesorhizobium sp. M6A.T.Cr.TU.017.01.1.1]
MGIKGKGGEAPAVAADVSDALKVFAAANKIEPVLAGRSTGNRSMSCPTIRVMSDDLALKTTDSWLLYNDQAFAHFD